MINNENNNSFYIFILILLFLFISFNKNNLIIQKKDVNESATDFCGELFGGTGFNCIIYDVNYEENPIDTPTEIRAAEEIKKWKLKQCKLFIEENERKH